MTEDEFLERWNSERPLYEAWGRRVASKLVELIGPLVAPVSTDVFIRIPISSRVKSDGSFLVKAFYRKKPYTNPFDEITDKVGVRLVLLLASHMHIVQKAIEMCPEWTSSKDKDFEAERTSDPYTFPYQSDHYVVRSSAPMTIEGLQIPAGLPCEIQVRTLLQHAQSELTHDTIYKPSVVTTPLMLRATAKSMALIEATNDYFEEVMKLVDAAVGESRRFSEALGSLYRNYVDRPADPTRAEGLILDAYADDPSPAMLSSLTMFLTSKPFIAKLIHDRSQKKILFRQPSILLVYQAVSQTPIAAVDRWPLTKSEIEPIYSDLGEALPN
jgi:putative GTP pyrophosphokinase